MVRDWHRFLNQPLHQRPQVTVGPRAPSSPFLAPGCDLSHAQRRCADAGHCRARARPEGARTTRIRPLRRCLLAEGDGGEPKTEACGSWGRGGSCAETRPGPLQPQARARHGAAWPCAGLGGVRPLLHVVTHGGGVVFLVGRLPCASQMRRAGSGVLPPSLGLWKAQG